jgi:head-tail adaptor
MQPGRMDRRVVFQRRKTTSVRDRGGFEDIHTAWASYRAVGAREQAQAGQAVDMRTATLTIRDTAGARTITNGCLALVDGAEHHVASVAPPGRTGFLELTILSGLPQA